MVDRKRRAVELVGDEDLRGALDQAQRQAFRVPVAGLERDPAGLSLRQHHRDQVAQSHAAKLAGAHQLAADVVADALEGHILVR